MEEILYLTWKKALFTKPLPTFIRLLVLLDIFPNAQWEMNTDDAMGVLDKAY